MSRLKKKKNNGFMLLEVILSVFIIASGLVFIIRAFTVSLRSTEAARRTQKACLALEEQLFELDAKGQVEEGISSGELQDGAYRWGMSAQPIDDKKEINLVELQVSGAKDPARKIKIATYIRNKST